MSLSVVDATGAVRSVTLDRITAGWSLEERRYPGLAVDFAGRRAFVVTRDTVAEVDLATLGVTHHAIPIEPRAPVGRPMTFDNANSFDGWSRTARWLGNGRIAVSGQDYGRAGSNVQLFRPAGLRLVDTQAWAVQVIDVHPSRFEFIDDTLLTSSPRSRRTAVPSISGARRGRGSSTTASSTSPRTMAGYARCATPGPVHRCAASRSI